MRRFAIFACLGLLAGCAATPPKFGTAPPVPDSRVFDRSMTVSGPDKGQIYVVRWTDAVGAGGIDARVYVDGVRVANVGKGEGFRAFVTPGKHTVGVKLLGVDSVDQPVRYRDVEVSAGEVREFEIFWAGSAFDIQPHT